MRGFNLIIFFKAQFKTIYSKKKVIVHAGKAAAEWQSIVSDMDTHISLQNNLTA